MSIKLATVAAAAVTFLAHIHVALDPSAGAKIIASATVTAVAHGTQVTFDVSHVPPHAKLRAVLNAGSCAHPSASFADAGEATSSSAGRATWTSRITFRSMPVLWRDISGRGHVLILLVNGKAEACGSIRADARR